MFMLKVDHMAMLWKLLEPVESSRSSGCWREKGIEVDAQP